MKITYTIEKVYSKNERVDMGLEFSDRDKAEQWARKYEDRGLSLRLKPYSCEVMTHIEADMPVIPAFICRSHGAEGRRVKMGRRIKKLKERGR